ncbi:MAG: AraC family transcriptional regulator, partial [Muribaculaceae bacterium]|nr:AraC family transcriptional regulator [Muribaculaceae bacterium]
MSRMSHTITEITPLGESDCFYLVDLHKTYFDYPVHRHEEYELNFVSNCNGARRIVGDSMEELSTYDLVLVGPDIEHGWENHNHPECDMREITIQFASDFLEGTFLSKTQMSSLRTLFNNARTGIAFHLPAIMKIYDRLDDLTQAQPGFIRMLRLLEILYYLSISSDFHLLSSTSFSNVHTPSDSRRILKVQEAISRDYAKPIYLGDMASLAGMTPTAFSRFFKLRTGRTLSEYIIDVRIGHAARALVDTTKTIAEVCYECGFNNISNFNRIFKRKKGCTPKV